MKITFVILKTLVIVGRAKIGVSMHFLFSATLCSVYCTQKGTRKIYIIHFFIYYNYRILSTKFGKFYKEQKGQFIKTVRVKLVDYKTYKGRRDGIYIQIKEVSASESTLILQSKTLTLIDKITQSNLPDSIFYLDYRR